MVHGAAVTAGLEREKNAAADIFTVNLLGAMEVMEAALRHGVRQVVQLGTGSVFGSAGRSKACWTKPAPCCPTRCTASAVRRRAHRRALSADTRPEPDRAAAGHGLRPLEYDTGVRDTLSLPLQLSGIAEAGGQAVVHSLAADDWVYSVDVARGILAVLDRGQTPDPVYHLSAGARWSVRDWCERLRERFRASPIAWPTTWTNAPSGATRPCSARRWTSPACAAIPATNRCTCWSAPSTTTWPGGRPWAGSPEYAAA